MIKYQNVTAVMMTMMTKVLKNQEDLIKSFIQIFEIEHFSQLKLQRYWLNLFIKSQKILNCYETPTLFELFLSLTDHLKL